MENRITTKELYGEDPHMRFTPEIKNSLYKLSKWAKIVGIAGMVFTVMTALPILFLGTALPAMPEEVETGTFINVIMVALLTFAFYLMYLLYHFASKMMIALKEDDENLTLVAIESLRKHYTLYGILMLVYIGMFALMFLFVILFGSSAL